MLTKIVNIVIMYNLLNNVGKLKKKSISYLNLNLNQCTYYWGCFIKSVK